MADTKITGLAAVTAPVDADVLAIAQDTAGTPVTKKITLAVAKDFFKTYFDTIYLLPATAATTYLKLDASNDPITGILNFSGTAATIGLKMENSDNKGYAVAFGATLPVWVDATSPNARIDSAGNFVFNSGSGGDLYFNYDRRATGVTYFDGANVFNFYDTSRGNVFYGASIFNEGGADLDTRFEGDTDANLLFIDAGTDRVGIGTGTPIAGYKLDLRGRAYFYKPYVAYDGFQRLDLVADIADVAIGLWENTGLAGGARIHFDALAAPGKGLYFSVCDDSTVGSHIFWASKSSRAVAIGVEAGDSGSGSNSVAVGRSSYATGSQSTAIGFQANAQNAYAVAVGPSSRALGEGAVAIGYGCYADTNYSFATGLAAYVQGASSAGSQAYGSGVLASGSSCIAFGLGHNGVNNYVTNSTASSILFGMADASWNQWQHLYLYYGSLVVNENGSDLDFRVEGDTDPNLLFVDASTDRIGFGTATPEYFMSLGGNVARTLAMNRHSTADTAGNALTIQSGGATSGATNKAGGALTIKSGIGTGNAIPADMNLAVPIAGASGTTDETYVNKFMIHNKGYTMPDNTYVDIFSVNLPTTNTGGVVHLSFTYTATDGTNCGTHSGIYVIALANDGGTVVGVVTDSGEAIAGTGAGGVASDSQQVVSVSGTTVKLQVRFNNTLSVDGHFSCQVLNNSCEVFSWL